MAENVAAAANLATEERAATVVTAGKVDKVANVATVVKAVTTGAVEKVVKTGKVAICGEWKKWLKILFL